MGDGISYFFLVFERYIVYLDDREKCRMYRSRHAARLGSPSVIIASRDREQ